MKGMAYILAFYLVLLSVVPCCAFDSCPDEKAATGQAADHQSEDEHCGNCSPFFNCESCAFISIHEDPVAYTVPSPVIKRVYTQFITPFLPDTHQGFWQPPRLG